MMKNIQEKAQEARKGANGSQLFVIEAKRGREMKRLRRRSGNKPQTLMKVHLEIN